MCEVYPALEVLFYTAKNIARDALHLEKGDKIVITGGSKTGASGNTDTIRIETI
jgi:pyruvate kinase